MFLHFKNDLFYIVCMYLYLYPVYMNWVIKGYIERHIPYIIRDIQKKSWSTTKSLNSIQNIYYVLDYHMPRIKYVN